MAPCAGQGIVERRAGEVLKSAQRVGACANRVLCRRQSKADRHACCGVFVRHRVDAGAAGEHVVAAVAFQRVVLARARQVLDVGKGVALGVAAAAYARGQTDIDPCQRGGIGRRVGASAAVQRIGAAKTGKDVVADVAGDNVVSRVAGRVDIA